MNRETLDRWCERGILGLVLAILVFGPLATGAEPKPMVRALVLDFQGWVFLVLQALTVAVVALWLLRLWLSPHPRLLWPPVCWGVILLVACALWRYQQADIEYVARLELIRILVYAFLFFAVLNNLHRQESTQIIAFTLIFLAVGISFYALYQFLSGSDHVWWTVTPYKGRGCGTYYSPNHLAGFLELLLPLALAYTVMGRGKALTKVFLGYAALVIVAGIGVTVSRGSWAACTAALLVLFGILARQRSHRLPALLLMLVLLAGGAYFVTSTDTLQSRLRRTFEGANVQRDSRYQIWEATVHMWRDYVWFGVGPGHFDYRFRAYRPAEVQLRPDRAHNEFLNVLADWGVAGAAIVALTLGALGWGVLKTWKYVRRSDNDFAANRSNKSAFVLGATLGLLALFLHSAVDFNMQIPANAMLAVSLMALLSSHLRFATERFWVVPTPALKGLLSLALLAGAFYLGRQEVRLGRECVWLTRAVRLWKSPDVETTTLTSTLERAGVAEPMNPNTASALGEAYRIQGWPGGGNSAALFTNAMMWFARNRQLNRFDAYSHLGCGMCLDKLDKHEEAGPWFYRADELDPNGYYTAAWIGWHYVQIEDYAAAKPWFERSLRLEWATNNIASSYLPIVLERLQEKAANPSGRSAR